MGSAILPDVSVSRQQATSGAPELQTTPAATTLIAESDALVALRRAETPWLYSRAIGYRPLRGASPIPGITLVGIGAVSLHIVIPLLAVVALSHVVIKFLETYPANSKARFAAKMRRQVIKGKVSIDVAERLMHLDDPGTADNGTGSLATSRADPTSPQHLQRFPEAPSTLWPTWELPEDYELPAQQEETKLVKLVRLVVDASTAHRRQR